MFPAFKSQRPVAGDASQAVRQLPREARPLLQCVFGGPGDRAETPQHYSEPRVSLGSRPWRDLLGLAASAPSEPYGPRARAARQALSPRLPGRTGSSCPAPARI